MKWMNEHSYYLAQMKKLQNRPIRVKFTSDKGETHWMNINKFSIEVIIDYLQDRR